MSRRDKVFGSVNKPIGLSYEVKTKKYFTHTGGSTKYSENFNKGEREFLQGNLLLEKSISAHSQECGIVQVWPCELLSAFIAPPHILNSS